MQKIWQKVNNMNEKGFNLYWENYRRAFEWQNNSHISHWKARVKALEVENALLREFILQEQGMHQQGLLPQVNFFEKSNKNCTDNEDHHQDIEEEAEYSSESEIDEELLAFYETTMRHKIERNETGLPQNEGLVRFLYSHDYRRQLILQPTFSEKKQSLEQRDSDDSQNDTEKIYSMGPIASSQKSNDMALLYGNDAPKILSMELSMQINFDMNRNKSNAQLWPNIPLRLSR